MTSSANDRTRMFGSTGRVARQVESVAIVATLFESFAGVETSRRERRECREESGTYRVIGTSVEWL